MVTDSNHHDRARELKALDNTKGGVKGLVDSGITKLPWIFFQDPPLSGTHDHSKVAGATIPVIDLGAGAGAGAVGADLVLRRGMVEEMCAAAETYGFFQLVNHGISTGVLEETLAGTQRFFDQDVEEKRQEILVGYSKQVMELTLFLLELLSEPLDLPPNYLKDMGCAEGHVIHCHYCPPCPEPEKTMSTPRHSDNTFITVLLQDQIGGLQVLRDNQWLDVPPMPGALVVNIGDFFQSVEHRALANRVGPRVSLASFFNGTHLLPNPRLYGPIKELVSDTNPAKYRETRIRDYLLAALDEPGISGLVRLRL